jgi:hypothetical protein
MSYYEKYLKYKSKYLNLKSQIGGESVRFAFEISRTVEEELKTKLFELIKERYRLTPSDIRINFRYRDGNIFMVEIENFKQFQLSGIQSDIVRIRRELIGTKESPELIKQRTFDELLLNITKEDGTGKFTQKIIGFFETMSPDDLFNYIQIMKNRIDFDKTLLYYIARTGNLALMKYLITKLGEDKIRELLKIRANDGRTVLFGAVNAVENESRKEIYTLIRDLTDTSLYKVTFMHNGKEPKNMKEWAELRGYHMSKEPSDVFIYEDVTRLVTT